MRQKHFGRYDSSIIVHTANGMPTAFHKAAEYQRYRVHMHPIAERTIYDVNRQALFSTRKQVGVDVDLAINLIESQRRDAWNHLMLVAGDGDLVSVVKLLVEVYDVAVTIVGSSNARSGALVPYVRCIEFADVLEAICRPGASRTISSLTPKPLFQRSLPVSAAVSF